jgi:predicted amidophosphoribosyltransferase
MLKSLRKYIIYLIDYIAPQRMDALVVKNLEKGDILKLPKTNEILNMDWIHPLFQYKENRVRAIIWELKYKENTLPLYEIGGLLYDEIISLISDILIFQSDAKFLLIPIPISTLRRIERGYNQSEYIAKSILPYDTEHILTYAPQWLTKIKETEIQSKSISRQDRMKNLDR